MAPGHPGRCRRRPRRRSRPTTLAVGDVVTLRSGPDRAVFTHRIIRIVERDGRTAGSRPRATPTPAAGSVDHAGHGRSSAGSTWRRRRPPATRSRCCRSFSGMRLRPVGRRGAARPGLVAGPARGRAADVADPRRRRPMAAGRGQHDVRCGPRCRADRSGRRSTRRAADAGARPIVTRSARRLGLATLALAPRSAVLTARPAARRSPASPTVDAGPARSPPTRSPRRPRWPRPAARTST